LVIAGFSKKKGTIPLHLKTDSFVVESNVHFPTDYNLLWDCARKCLDQVSFFIEKHPQIEGWRKIKNWYSELKAFMRKLGRISGGGGKNKEEKLREAATLYLQKCNLLLSKLLSSKKSFPVDNEIELAHILSLERYIELFIKHIDLVNRRILQGEKIPHEEKMMSIFETYTQWIVKGKFRPSVELGKKVSITSDQFGLILFHKIMTDEQDRDIVIETADYLLNKYHSIVSMSFDKGHWSAENKALLVLNIPLVVLPKLGKRTIEEKKIENSRPFKRLKNKHSAVESNINELEHRGLNRCPDRGYPRFCSYIALGVSAYNLKKIGKKILDDQVKEEAKKRVA
jgi:hypothetical protein